ncbi:RES family NAD+ phosphorylase [Paraburkholderia silviterrae]|uniref:RES domain-containing protein n=1 Tax=Paraburkholderia silviterrae TaxID=2528715 RepID=A0A4R5LXM9_9BURK|nr:RES family NAD+ phosphorylase [Paraburkholderia silviterrae]TDG16814.1 RES domain-containing protein [Paraburkholderia silviterrae]
MTAHVWRIATDTPDYTADDMTGEGAKRTGGRWNRPGKPVLYTAENRSLACLETLVHLGGALPLNRYLVRIDIADAVWRRAQKLDHTAAPIGWDAIPKGKASLDYGDAWLTANTSALLLVPSAIVPEEFNVLINPSHKDIARVKATKMRRWSYDARIW